uniref:Uncharacterized protein n=1 Tax=Arundo donax TaxID=35708 RepID=A0A0A8Z5F5_ARUDO
MPSSSRFLVQVIFLWREGKTGLCSPVNQ